MIPECSMFRVPCSVFSKDPKAEKCGLAERGKLNTENRDPFQSPGWGSRARSRAHGTTERTDLCRRATRRLRQRQTEPARPGVRRLRCRRALAGAGHALLGPAADAPG